MTTHALYIPIDDKGKSGKQAAGYLSEIAGPMRDQGVAFDVYQVRPKDLKNKAVLKAFRQRGIHNLPAILANGRPLVGLRRIREHYEKFLAERYPRSDPADTNTKTKLPTDTDTEAPEDDAADADLQNFFNHEMHHGHRRPGEALAEEDEDHMPE